MLTSTPWGGCGDRLVTGEAGIGAEFFFGDNLVGGLVLVADDLDAGGEHLRRRQGGGRIVTTYPNVVELHDGGWFGGTLECLCGNSAEVVKVEKIALCCRGDVGSKIRFANWRLLDICVTCPTVDGPTAFAIC